MIHEFRFDLFKKEDGSEPLIVSVCGINIPPENGFLLVNGKLGTLGVCADGRLQFLPYPFEVTNKSVKDEYTLIVNTGKKISIRYWWHGGKLYSEKM